MGVRLGPDPGSQGRRADSRVTRIRQGDVPRTCLKHGPWILRHDAPDVLCPQCQHGHPPVPLTDDPDVVRHMFQLVDIDLAKIAKLYDLITAVRQKVQLDHTDGRHASVDETGKQ